MNVNKFSSATVLPTYVLIKGHKQMPVTTFFLSKCTCIELIFQHCLYNIW